MAEPNTLPRTAPEEFAEKGDIRGLLALIDSSKRSSQQSDACSCLPDTVSSAAKRGLKAEFECLANSPDILLKVQKVYLVQVVVLLNELDPKGIRNLGDAQMLENLFDKAEFIRRVVDRSANIAVLIGNGELGPSSAIETEKIKRPSFLRQKPYLKTLGATDTHSRPLLRCIK